MNIQKIISILIISITVILPIAAESVVLKNFDSIRITQNDIPEGYQYGLIPDFARDTLQTNPWMMTRGAITRLAKNIYPNGDASVIKNMHISIIARKERPYNDDIVCYIIEYKDAVSGRKEFDKLTEFSRVNSDRTVVIQRGTLAVFMLVDDVRNHKYIVSLKDILEKRISNN